MAEFFDMGGYGQWIWSAYGVTFAILLAMLVFAFRMARLHRQRSEDLSRNRPSAGHGDP